MKYELTCLTPTLIGDGSRLSPIDYMVWRDQVNVLDQGKIFRLLAKGPRLESYLKQIHRAEKLEFAAWGGFAQNFAHRRIPFETPDYSRIWEALPSENLHIPTFVSSHEGPYLPGSAIKGALRTAFLSARVTEESLTDLTGERAQRNPGVTVERAIAGNPGRSQTKTVGIGDSNSVERSAMKVFMLRTASLAKTKENQLTLRWKQSPKGSVDGGKPEAGTPVFAEMASPGTVFSGTWKERAFYLEQEVARSLGWKTPLNTEALLRHGNEWAERQLASHKLFAQATGLTELVSNLTALQEQLASVKQGGKSCLLCIGWAGGFLSKSGGPPTSTPAYREYLGGLSFYSSTIRAGLPFPKTRRIVFLNNRPATLPGWVRLDVL